jgi:hypothetical protein
MAVRVKLVQATIIRDKNIARQVIAEVRRTPSSERLAEIKERDKVFMNMIRNANG